MGWLEPVRAAPRADDRARRAARAGRRHRGRRRCCAGRAHRRRANRVPRRARVAAAVAVRDVVQLPGARRGPRGELGPAGATSAPAPGPARRDPDRRCPPASRARAGGIRTARRRGSCGGAASGGDRAPAREPAGDRPDSRRVAVRRRAHRRDAGEPGGAGGVPRRGRARAASFRRRRRGVADPGRVAGHPASAAAAADRRRRVRRAGRQRRPPIARRGPSSRPTGRDHPSALPAVGAGPGARARRARGPHTRGAARGARRARRWSGDLGAAHRTAEGHPARG